MTPVPDGRARVLVLGAGSGASNSLIRSLKADSPACFIVGCHHDPFILRQSSADRRYLTPALTHGSFADALGQAVERERVDLVVPNTDAEVKLISRLRDHLPCRVFLPRPSVITRCQDKYNLTAFLRSRGLPAPLTYPVADLDDVAAAFRRLAPRSTLWCRIRRGSGSVGAIPVKTVEQAASWIRYWEDMRGVPASAFTISEYLPGRDFACQSLWRDGQLVLAKTAERVSYFGGAARPSGVSSVAALARTVREPRVLEICAKAIRTLDRHVTGAFSVDLKEDAEGVPCITEINVGRFITMNNLFDLTGRYNMSATYVRLAMGESVDLHEEYDVGEGYYFMRDVDAVPGIFHARELIDAFEDVRGSRPAPAVNPTQEPGGNGDGGRAEGRRSPAGDHRDQRREAGAVAGLQAGDGGSAEEVSVQDRDEGDRQQEERSESGRRLVAGSAAKEGEGRARTPRLQIIGRLPPQAVEALRLEVQRLALRHGVEVKQFRVDKR